ncbi:MAG: hypothetical protein KGL39_52690 [Patescibacteria group bacterium]|nr:hypothetical protein [Patescibacteria group bacterium]
MKKTFDADTGQPVTDAAPLTTPNGTVASIVNIPPQIATTIVWVALGFAICWYLTRPKRRDSHL